MSKIAKNIFLVNRYEALKKLENFFSQVDPKIMHNATFTEYMSNRFLHIAEDTKSLSFSTSPQNVKFTQTKPNWHGNVLMFTTSTPHKARITKISPLKTNLAFSLPGIQKKYLLFFYSCSLRERWRYCVIVSEKTGLKSLKESIFKNEIPRCPKLPHSENSSRMLLNSPRCCRPLICELRSVSKRATNHLLLSRRRSRSRDQR